MIIAKPVTKSPPVPVAGPGTHLHCLLAGWGIVPDASCGCDDKASEMDVRGPVWCRDNLEMLVDWLMEPARARLLLGALVRIAPDAARDVARNLVLEAILLAEGGQP
jgi:hypothetical protein